MLNEQSRVLSSCRTLSWTAIFAGALVGVGLGFILSLFSVAIGLSAYASTSDGAMTIAVGGLVGIAIGIIASMFASGYVAGYLDRPKCVLHECPKHHSGALNGFVAWCVALIISVSMAPHIHHYVHAYGDFVSNPASTLAIEKPGSALDAAASNAATPADDTNTVSASNTAKSAFLIFALFILGALSSAIGGHYGMCGCCKKSRYCDTDTLNNTTLK